MTSEANLKPQEEQKVAQTKIWRIRWLGDGWYLVLH